MYNHNVNGKIRDMITNIKHKSLGNESINAVIADEVSREVSYMTDFEKEILLKQVLVKLAELQGIKGD